MDKGGAFTMTSIGAMEGDYLNYKNSEESQIDHIWSRACEFIKSEMSAVSYNTFIDVLSPVMLSENSLIVSAPNTMVKSTIEKYYASSINACVSRVAQSIENITVVLPGDIEKSQFKIRNLDYGNLYAKYTFHTFVVGNSNHFAHAAALAVAQSPSRAYNPLFIYGGVGLGKTHLMHAIGHYVQQNNLGVSVMYVTSETFTNEMIQSISTNKNKEFRNKYRNVDLLMVDDIQFIARKEGVQEEFFHTFNTLHNANKQIIISSDKPPKEISQLEERLRSRFEWGLIADIQPPDLETRIAILKKRADEENSPIPDSVLEFIAERIISNIRELEGYLTRVIAYARFNKMDINVNVATSALKDIFPFTTPQILTPMIIKSAVASYYGLSEESLSAKRRDQHIAFPRQVAMYLSRTMTDWSLPKIGDVYGGRNHTTVLHAHDKIEELLKKDITLTAAVEDIKKRLYAQ
jgi:chromosomal replication initiator protein